LVRGPVPASEYVKTITTTSQSATMMLIRRHGILNNHQQISPAVPIGQDVSWPANMASASSINS